jgi:hypothetical protein
MLHLQALLYLVFLFCSIKEPKFTNFQSYKDSVFIRWNQITIHSLERQIKLTTDSTRKEAYRNRLSAIKGYLNIKKVEDVNIKSIRYKFLDTLFSGSNERKRDFYIIESNSSGSVVSLKIFVVYLKSTTNKAEVVFYRYGNEKWNKKGETKISNWKTTFKLINDIVKYPSGFNENDVIVTKFENNVIESEYYLNGTLSISSGFKVIFDAYDKILNE